MQDRYVGDIGDFGKYALLNFIQQKTNLKLGVNWYLTDPDKLGEKQKNDGNLTGYESIKHLDKDLYEKLKKLVDCNTRHVSEVENMDNGILANGTVFFSDEVAVGNRNDWFNRAIQHFSDYRAQIVFMDPDNGCCINSISGAKHVRFDEIVGHYHEAKQSMIVYNHCNRKPPDKYRDYFRPLFEIAEYLPSVRFRRKSARDYFFVLQEAHRMPVVAALHEFLKTPWGQKAHGFATPHFTPTPCWYDWQ
ncbi:MAG: hypothetical protein BWY28_00542 [bacterium ADurb.Bin236]|nr:MAG: hypothetical protein BWY28_00542 [bacterium ADurb.Bin236]HOY62831.1 hypothetical protein [bacterium]HPN94294.1 hypothetical protein [bacterium]